MMSILLRSSFCIALIVSCSQLCAQKISPAADSVAFKVAKRIQDSLSLNNEQRSKLYEANVDLQRQKMKAREKGKDRGEIGRELQKAENKRDKAYEKILTAQQYRAYLKRKHELISAY